MRVRVSVDERRERVPQRHGASSCQKHIESSSPLPLMSPQLTDRLRGVNWSLSLFLLLLLLLLLSLSLLLVREARHPVDLDSGPSSSTSDGLSTPLSSLPLLLLPKTKHGSEAGRATVFGVAVVVEVNDADDDDDSCVGVPAASLRAAEAVANKGGDGEQRARAKTQSTDETRESSRLCISSANRSRSSSLSAAGRATEAVMSGILSV